MGNFIKLENFSKLLPYVDMFKEGLIVTVLLAFFTVIIGFVLALVLALMRMSNFHPFGFLGLTKDGHLRDGGFLFMRTMVCLEAMHEQGLIQVEHTADHLLIRSTPVVVQVFIIYYGIFSTLFELPSIRLFGFIRFERFFPGVVALAMNSGAYLCEIIRSGIQSIDGGQTEAARSLGLSQGQNMRFIILPQAIKNILPAIGNEFVTIIKESAITYTIGVQDIMATVNTIRGSAFIIMEPLLVATGLYFCLCFPLSKLIAYIERRMSRGDRR